ncbi:ACT domain-containing protein [Pseudonocardia acidicola]|uniref:ACT domain-containing protein n=1 Tax=Pseudonocardia acidicola TaxID=2724939 RepID=A0ABX1SHR2_9PSEU|nr:ACT domain-containing protein [Pseudonocardia acidicola]NMI00606.1 hypothetical protein [Pseudonocardia acidicola]
MNTATLPEATLAALRAHRCHEVRTTDGLDGVLRVVTLLRGRGYRVRNLSVDVREGAGLSTVRCTVSLTDEEASLLVSRLARLPSVVGVDAL